MRIALATLLMVVFNHAGFSQTSKPHFDIKNAASPEETNKIYNAVKDFDFEQYRFYNKRRVIKFSNSNTFLELYSAKELLDIYQRPVHPLNIMNDTPTKELEFIYFPEAGKVKISIN